MNSITKELTKGIFDKQRKDAKQHNLKLLTSYSEEHCQLKVVDMNTYNDMEVTFHLNDLTLLVKCYGLQSMNLFKDSLIEICKDIARLYNKKVILFNSSVAELGFPTVTGSESELFMNTSMVCTWLGIPNVTIPYYIIELESDYYNRLVNIIRTFHHLQKKLRDESSGNKITLELQDKQLTYNLYYTGVDVKLQILHINEYGVNLVASPDYNISIPIKSGSILEAIDEVLEEVKTQSQIQHMISPPKKHFKNRISKLLNTANEQLIDNMHSLLTEKIPALTLEESILGYREYQMVKKHNHVGIKLFGYWLIIKEKSSENPEVGLFENADEAKQRLLNLFTEADKAAYEIEMQESKNLADCIK